MKEPGLFSLRTPADLLAKLRREFTRMEAEPENVDHAFNFFVTADHIPDWIHPGGDDAARGRRNGMRSAHILLQTAHHLANGAKHFAQLQAHHQSVRTTHAGATYFGARYFGRRFFGGRYFGSAALVVSLEEEAAEQLGTRQVTAGELARQVLAYWEDPERQAILDRSNPR